jgi:hypothetical protein
MQRRLINSQERKATREELVALAMDYSKKMENWQQSVEAAARRAGVSATTIARTLRISHELHPSVLRMFDRGQISIRQADRLTRLPKGKQRNALPAMMPTKPLTMVVDISRLR